jgi:hypothetical protein
MDAAQPQKKMQKKNLWVRVGREPWLNQMAGSEAKESHGGLSVAYNTCLTEATVMLPSSCVCHHNKIVKLDLWAKSLRRLSKN